MRKIGSAILGGLALLGAPSAIAATTSGSMTVQITIQTSCVVSASVLNFGAAVGVLTADVPGTATITVTCTPGTPYVVGLDAGANESSANDVDTRRMENGGAYVSYQLYKGADHAVVWGTATALGETGAGEGVGGTGNGSGQAITVHGLVPAQTTPAAATYTDTVAILVTY